MRPPQADAAARACGNCGAPMTVLTLQGHYGHPVELDLCRDCHLVWFDALESARFGGAALLELVGAMAQAQGLAHQPLRPDLACPRCRGPLKQVHNQTRWGRSRHLECRQGHGGWTSFAEFLAERGLVRTMSAGDRRAWLAREGTLDCLNCGAPVGAADDACRHCGSVPALFDLARLAQALDPEGATVGNEAADQVRRRGPDARTHQCLACGAAVPPKAGLRCPQCDATLAVSGLRLAHERLARLAPLLPAPGRRPPAHVRRSRIAAQSTDLGRRREWAAQMQAEADARAGRSGRVDAPWPDLPSGWLAWLSAPGAAWRLVVGVLVALAALWLV